MQAVANKKYLRERIYLSDDEYDFLQSMKKASVRDAVKECIRLAKIRARARERDVRRRTLQRLKKDTSIAH
jgi:hypothetical protein